MSPLIQDHRLHRKMNILENHRRSNMTIFGLVGNAVKFLEDHITVQKR
jgi:hypothetical protein